MLAQCDGFEIESALPLTVSGAVASTFLKEVKGHNLEPTLVFHGTPRANHAGILRQGLVPGGTRGVRVANGSAYGQGIYLGRTLSTSHCYARGDNTIFVCAMVENRHFISSHGNIIVCTAPEFVCPLFLVTVRNRMYGESGFRHNEERLQVLHASFARNKAHPAVAPLPPAGVSLVL